MKPNDLDRLLADLAQEDPPESARAAVRARVMGKIQERRLMPWVWATVLGTLALLALVVLPVRVERFPDVTLFTPKPPALESPEPIVQQARAPAIRRRKPTVVRASIPAAEDTNFVKLMTDDPDVVILWSMD